MDGLSVSDVMTTVVVPIHDTDALGAEDVAVKLGRFRHVPVVDKHGHLQGTLSVRDALATALAGGERRVAVSRVMTREVIAVRPETGAREALDLLLEHRLGALPVIDAEGKLLGVVSETELLVAARDAFGKPSIYYELTTE